MIWEGRRIRRRYAEALVREAVLELADAGFDRSIALDPIRDEADQIVGSTVSARNALAEEAQATVIYPTRPACPECRGKGRIVIGIACTRSGKLKGAVPLSMECARCGGRG